MRFSISIVALVVPSMPISANAEEVLQRLAYDAKTLNCSTGFDNVIAPTKRLLLADEQAGQLIERKATLVWEQTPEGASIPTDASADAGAGTSCPNDIAFPTDKTAYLTAIGSRSARMHARMSQMPLVAARITSRFGMRVHPLFGEFRMHSGVDLAAPVGTPIFATESGEVSNASWKGGYGLFASIEHSNGLQTRYGHMSRLNVRAGQRVEKGAIIGFVGSTGQSTGAHLHYEVRFKGQSIDPIHLLAPGATPHKSERHASVR